MNNRLAGNEPGRALEAYVRSPKLWRPHAPCDKSGSFTGDLCFETLEGRCKAIGEGWAALARELGFGTGIQESPPYARAYRLGRLYVSTFTGGVWSLEDLDRLMLDRWESRQFLFRVNAQSTSLGHRVIAQPEDVLTMLVLCGKRECFDGHDLLEMGFTDALTESLAHAMTDGGWDPRPPV
jgi:hypothetical protein